ncbi:hypothetical protein MYX76_17985, partial [Desulfobacterota bacterium AH_259_B03_O07]|nr:hypothetical protein [Desulfobacterota bacterium AH_259_B03_O07]
NAANQDVIIPDSRNTASIGGSVQPGNTANSNPEYCQNESGIVPKSAINTATHRWQTKKKEEIKEYEEEKMDRNSNSIRSEKLQDNYYMNQWRKMNAGERRLVDFEAQQLINFGSNIKFSGNDSPELNRYRVQALKNRGLN